MELGLLMRCEVSLLLRKCLVFTSQIPSLSFKSFESLNYLLLAKQTFRDICAIFLFIYYFFALK